MNLRDRIKQICTEKNISVAQLERMAGLGEKTINRWDTVTPSVAKVQKVADALEVTMDELLDK